MTSNSGLFNRRFADNFIPQPANTSLEIGQIAPDFELPRVQGDPVRLSDYRGQKPVVLAFTRIYRVPPIGGGVAGAARPEFFFASDGSLQQRVRIVIAEGQGLAEITAVARHEIGHGLGLWGHSPNLRDLMYGGHHAAATGNRRVLRVPNITKRDLNTLKRVYEQPTLIGQVFPESERKLF